MSEKDAFWNYKRKKKEFAVSRSKSTPSASSTGPQATQGPLDNFMRKKVKKKHYGLYAK